MDKTKKFLQEFAKRYEYTRMKLRITFFTNQSQLKAEILQKVCYPEHHHTKFFQEYIGSISNSLTDRLQNSLKEIKPGKIKK
jgi:hypothetical protein